MLLNQLTMKQTIGFLKKEQTIGDDDFIFLLIITNSQYLISFRTRGTKNKIRLMLKWFNIGLDLDSFKIGIVIGMGIAILNIPVELKHSYPLMQK